MGTVIKDDEADEFVWALFGLRVSICESEGSMRIALEKREHELVEALADLIDPHAHVALPPSPIRAPRPSIF